jgi:hypothetical protein
MLTFCNAPASAAPVLRACVLSPGREPALVVADEPESDTAPLASIPQPFERCARLSWRHPPRPWRTTVVTGP